MNRPTVADAMAEARAASAGLKAHEDLCAERYGNIHGTLGELKKLVWGAILSVCGFCGITLVSLILRGAGLG